MKITYAIAVALLALVGIRGATNAQTGACQASDSSSAGMIRVIQDMMVSSDSVRIKLQLPLVQSANVVMIQADSVCIQAQVALDDHISSTTATPVGLGSRPLYVIGVGDHFGVAEADTSDGHWSALTFFSPTWAYIGVLSW